MGVTVLVVGSGGREHALAWRLAGEGVDVAVAPGNGGAPWAVPIQATDVDGLARFATEQAVSLTIVGPEAPLAAGLVNTFAERGLRAFGPTRAAARLEWSKGWAKEFLRRRGIPTGKAELVDSEAGARRAVGRCGLPVVIKADGLAGGKGVWVAHTRGEVELALDALFRRRTLGAAGEQVLIEEYLDGVEVTVMVFTDGERLAIMPPARDYKRAADGDRGPNTGGMGGYSRPGYATPELLERIEHEIVRPTLEGMAAEGHAYRGVLYAQLMVTAGGPKVVEFNSRFGDPEAQLVLPLLRSSLVEVCAAVAEGRLEPDQVRWAPEWTCGVVLAAPGYPEAPRLGARIEGLDALPSDVLAFQAGTRLDEDGRLVTAGGRVLTLVASGRSLAEAREQVYAAVPRVRFEACQYRNDIGLEVPAPSVGVLA